VGDSRTYGKGTVRGVMNLTRMLGWANRKFDAGTVTYETAMFYRINGESNQQRGVAADIVLPSFTEEMEVGEMFNPNHLPWDKEAPVARPEKPLAADVGYVETTPEVIAMLKKHSQERFTQQSELKKLRDEIQRFKTMRDRREVSLNEARRLKEYYDEKAAADRAEALLDAADGEKPEKNGKNEDVLLKEALSITAEYAAIVEGKKRSYAGK